MAKFVGKRVENVVRKVQNAGNQHFSLFPTMLSKALYLRITKSWVCEVKS